MSLRNIIEFAVVCRWFLPFFLLIVFVFSCVRAWIYTCLLTSAGAHCVCRCAHDCLYACACMWRPSVDAMHLHPFTEAGLSLEPRAGRQSCSSQPSCTVSALSALGLQVGLHTRSAFPLRFWNLLFPFKLRAFRRSCLPSLLNHFSPRMHIHIKMFLPTTVSTDTSISSRKAAETPQVI